MFHSISKNFSLLLAILCTLNLFSEKSALAHALCGDGFGITPPGQICVIVRTDPPTNEVMMPGPTGSTAFMANVGDYQASISAGFMTGLDTMEVNLTAFVTRTANTDPRQHLIVLVEGGRTDPMPGYEATLFVDGEFTGPGLVTVGGGAGFEFLSHPTDLQFVGWPTVASYTAYDAEPFDVLQDDIHTVDDGSIALHTNNVFHLVNVGDSVDVPAGAYAGDGVFPQGSKRQIVLRLPVGEKLQHFPFEQFQVAYSETCPAPYYKLRPGLDAAISIEGGYAFEQKYCGVGLVSQVRRQTLGVIDEPTTLEEDYAVPEGEGLLITEQGSLMIPGGITMTIDGESTVANLGLIVVESDGTVFIGKGSELENLGVIENQHLIESHGRICNASSGHIENNETLANRSAGLFYNLGNINNGNILCNEGRIKNGGSIDGNPIEPVCN